jgi:pimeloyl-ACP methyl ester carboxylesterase
MPTPRTFVLVHGAWHGGWCWRRVADRLAADGHRVFTPTLTGLADRSHLIDVKINIDSHVADVANLIKWEGLTDIILCGHSYAGFVVSGVAEKALPAIASIVFLDAFVPATGDAMSAVTSQAVRDNIKATL